MSASIRRRRFVSARVRRSVGACCGRLPAEIVWGRVPRAEHTDFVVPLPASPTQPSSNRHPSDSTQYKRKSPDRRPDVLSFVRASVRC